LKTPLQWQLCAAPWRWYMPWISIQ
jgi:hypothetical protein